MLTDSAGAVAALQRAPGALTCVTVPVREPAPPAWALADLCFWWAPRDGGEVAGAGSALDITARGPLRFGEIKRRAGEALARVTAVEIDGGSDDAPFTPRLFGGLAFAPGSADAAPWTAFGDAWFVLPRLLYRREGERAWITIVVEGPRAGARERAVDEAARVVARMRVLAAERPVTPPPLAVRQLDPTRWRQQVEEIRDAIADGRTEKIVAARRAAVELAAPIDHAAILARLDARHPDCFRFAFRRGGAMFAGASPERLVARRGDRVESEAMAGSGGTARALLGSRKDRGEHAVVTRAIARALAPVCSSLEIPSAPEVRALRHVMHLCTPVRGVLERPRHLLDLAAALHPTPAVCGEPTGPALSWIAEHEEAPRGWYAGPVGWFDAAGDGELAVAIRAGLVAEDLAYVWAGAGIVSESDPDAEYAETGLKQRALFDVLGVE